MTNIVKQSSFLLYNFLIPEFLRLLARTHLAELALEMLYLSLQLLLVTSDLVLFETHHHKGFQFLLLSVGGTSGFVLGFVLELVLAFLDPFLIGFQLSFGHLVVSNLMGVDETMRVLVI
jgi:hypothetical protein